uniref:Cytochrome P450 86A2 n=1 Tax=Ananas comosus var. bracteatus TaxID=296719 RepID=A0A6V7PWX9_ANACO|nr:unnamed protein product [Ananas comosus var. bracteatus]
MELAFPVAVAICATAAYAVWRREGRTRRASARCRGGAARGAGDRHVRAAQPGARAEGAVRQLPEGPDVARRVRGPAGRRHLQHRRRGVAAAAQDGGARVHHAHAPPRHVAVGLALRPSPPPPHIGRRRRRKGPLDLQDLLLRLTFDNICGLAFGRDPETLAPPLRENAFAAAFDRATEATLRRFIFPEFVWRFKKLFRLGMESALADGVEHVERYLSAVIEARRLELKSGADHDDLLSRFMRKGSYSDSFLQEVALNFILAGRDTSSVALSWFFWLVSTHPAVERRILTELASVLSASRGTDTAAWLASPLAFEEADRLVYLKAALSETLRLYPSVPEDSKHVVADDILPDGTFVPAGSSITYSIYSAGRMKSVWGDDCLEFRPERWLTPDGKSYDPHDSFKFVAFNAGPRICLGKDLAYLQMKTVAAAVLLRYTLAVVSGHRVEQKMSLTLFMKHGLRMSVENRDLGSIVGKLRPTLPATAEGNAVAA